MADKEGTAIAKDYHTDTPFAKQRGFYIKGMADADWGIKSRMSRLFQEKSGHTVMLAFDHGCLMGPIAGLERLDLAIPPLAGHVDVLMGTRGALRTCVSPATGKGIVLRMSAGSSVMGEDPSREVLTVDTEEAVRMNADCMAVQCFLGEEGEKSSLDNLSRLVNDGMRYGIPVMGVVALGKQTERTSRFFRLATRILPELGAHIVKTYYCEDFEEITAACPVPVVVTGGKKLPEDEALTLCSRAMSEGAAGVDMGRNIFQSSHPVAMAKAVGMVVHQNASGKEAYEFFLDESGSDKKKGSA